MTQDDAVIVLFSDGNSNDDLVEYIRNSTDLTVQIFPVSFSSNKTNYIVLSTLACEFYGVHQKIDQGASEEKIFSSFQNIYGAMGRLNKFEKPSWS